MNDQRYVSDELCHFVGKGKSEQEQYDLLVNKILKSGWLTHPPHNPSLQRTASLDFSKPISTDEAIKYQVICFCDIPEPDLKLHIAKYSKFGLAFKKDFLIQYGACPVFYIANESIVPIKEVFSPDDFISRIKEALSQGNGVNRALYFDTSVRAVLDMLATLDALAYGEAGSYFKGIKVDEFKERMKVLFGVNDAQLSSFEQSVKGNTQAMKTIRMLTDFLMNYVFTYFKCFDAQRDIGDEKNYYMEREWRVSNNINFKLENISRVFLTKKYAAQFRKDLPSYLGQITLFD